MNECSALHPDTDDSAPEEEEEDEEEGKPELVFSRNVDTVVVVSELSLKIKSAPIKESPLLCVNDKRNYFRFSASSF